MAAPAFDLQPMSIGDILDRAVRLYKRAFLHFIGIMGIPVALAVPFGVLMVPVFGVSGRPGRSFGAAALVGFPFLFVLIWLSFVSVGALARSVSERFLGGTPTIGSVYKAALRRGLTLLWAYILFALAVGGLLLIGILVMGIVAGVAAGILASLGRGILAAVAGGILAVVMGLAVGVATLWLFIRLFLVTQVIVIEGQRGTRALQRSWSLMRGNFWRGLLIFIFGIAMNVVLFFVLQIPGFVLVAVIPGVVTVILQMVANTLANVLFAPFMGIAFTLLYYDSRIRHEAFDLEVMAQNLGAPGTSRGGPGASAAAPGPPPVARPAPAPPREPITLDETLLLSSPAAPAAPPGPPPPAPPPRPGGTPAAPRGPVGAFKVCPKCQAQVPLVRPTCPNCGTPVPFRPTG